MMVLTVLPLVMIPLLFAQISDRLKPKTVPRKTGMKIILKDFTVTAYCPGTCCNGFWAGMTATGGRIEHYLQKKIKIIAVDPELIPLGSYILYNGEKYLSADVGGKIKGRRLDILLPSHEETVRFGIKIKQTVELMQK